MRKFLNAPAQVLDWIDNHPRTLSYIALVVTAEFLLQVFNIHF